MQPPAYLWPLPWWTAVVAALLAMGVPWLVARLRVNRWNDEVKKLGPKLQDLGMTLDEDPFSVGEGKNVVVAEPEQLAVADLKRHSVVQVVPMRNAALLKIYDRPSNDIEFRVVLSSGAQTRAIKTRSIAGFGRLFGQFARAAKHVRYVQG